MACLDRRGLPLPTAWMAAAERYREGIDLLLSAWPGPGRWRGDRGCRRSAGRRWPSLGADAGCAAPLAPLAAGGLRIGGSGALRERAGDMLLLALMRGGETARAILDRRLHRRPSPRAMRWRRQLSA
jgi:hypothetical protein